MIEVACKKCGKMFPYQKGKRYCGVCEDSIGKCRKCGKTLGSDYPLCYNCMTPGEVAVLLAERNRRNLTIR